jgi:hypothetical protein
LDQRLGRGKRRVLKRAVGRAEKSKGGRRNNGREAANGMIGGAEIGADEIAERDGDRFSGW